MDFNNTIAQVVETNLSSSNPGTFNTFGFIGDNEEVDLYKVQLNTANNLSIDTRAETFGLNSVLRVFNTAGNQVAFSNDIVSDDSNASSTDSQIDFVATTAGTYYIGVSSSNNTEYDPKVEGSGNNSSTDNTTGRYELNVEVAPLNFTGTISNDAFVGNNASNFISDRW
jgi:hypothetical protein